MCDTCTSNSQTFDPQRPLLFGPHRGAAIADSADLIPDPGSPPGGADPFHDLLVGSTAGVWLKPEIEETFRNNTGTVVLFSAETIGGTPGATPTQCFEDGAAFTKLISRQFGDLFGFAVTAIGDLDDDNVDDFLVGAPRGPFPETETVGVSAPWEGRVYLYLSSDRANWGSPDWAPGTGGCTGECQTCTLDVGEPATAVTPFDCDYPGFYSAVPRASAILVPPGIANGPAGAQHFGFAMARAGDLDGDGVEDIAIGAPHSDNRTDNPSVLASEPGRCYLISGAKLAAAVLPSGQETLVVGNTTYDSMGVPVASVGDELLLGTLMPEDCSFGAPVGARMGHAMEGGVDLNGDTRDDLAIGAPQYRWIKRETGIKGYSGTSVGGAGFVQLIGGWVGPDQGTLNETILNSQWWLPISTYGGPGQNPPPLSPDYGEAFGFSLSTRVGEASPPAGGAPFDLVVGAPLFSDTPVDYVALPFPGIGDIWFPNWGNPAPPLSEPLTGRSYGRATVWAIPELPAMTTPASALWHYAGSETAELVGWEVKALGEIDGVPGQEIAICARNFSMNRRDATSVCATPCFQESDYNFAALCAAGGMACNEPDCDDNLPGIQSCGADSTAGGVSCGAVTIHLATDGEIVWEIRGEDPKDSLGWAISRITGRTTGGDTRFVLGAGRWAGDNEFGTDENGRAYVFEGQAIGGYQL